MACVGAVEADTPGVDLAGEAVLLGHDREPAADALAANGKTIPHFTRFVV